VTTQISELGRAQRRALVAEVERVAKIALTQREACASLGRSEELAVLHLRPRMHAAHRGCKRGFPADDLRGEAAEHTLCTGRVER
jgi:hypothetical protein